METAPEVGELEAGELQSPTPAVWTCGQFSNEMVLALGLQMRGSGKIPVAQRNGWGSNSSGL